MSIERARVPRFDLTGQRFGRLLVIRIGVPSEKSIRWICVCDCGAETLTTTSYLRSGVTKSCGCLKYASRNATHGMSKTPTYSSWLKMKERCLNPKTINYHRYGGRGITICPEWKYSFEQFFSDMGERPVGTSLERVKNGLGYSKENCIWLLNPLQSQNRRNNTWVLSPDGEELVVAEAARRYGIGQSTLSNRIRSGWPAKDLFLAPSNDNRKLRHL